MSANFPKPKGKIDLAYLLKLLAFEIRHVQPLGGDHGRPVS